METAIQTLRLVLSERPGPPLPKLKIVIGHMGEGDLRSMLDRIDETTSAEAKKSLTRSVKQTILDQGLDHHQWVLHHGAVHVGADDVRRGPDHVLGRLPLRIERAGARVPGRAAAGLAAPIGQRSRTATRTR